MGVTEGGGRTCKGNQNHPFEPWEYDKFVLRRVLWLSLHTWPPCIYLLYRLLLSNLRLGREFLSGGDAVGAVCRIREGGGVIRKAVE